MGRLTFILPLILAVAVISRALGQACSTSADCGSLPCGYDSVDGSASKICCASGSTVDTYVSRNEYGFTSSGTRDFCTGLSDGATCGDLNGVCSSGSCVLGTCAANKLADDEKCAIDNDCSSGACAYAAVDGEASMVCCASGSTIDTYVSRNEYGFTSSGRRDFCTGLSNGATCGDLNNICSSGLCICGVCEEAGFTCSTGICGPEGCLQDLLRAGAPCIADNNCILGKCGADGTCSYLDDSSLCTEGQDYQCSNQVCAREKAEPSASYICCPSGKQLTSDDASLSVCTATGVFEDPCFDDLLCESGVCIDGRCKTGLQKEGESCEKDEHCHSGDCSSLECSSFQTLDLHNSYYNNLAVCPLKTLDNSNESSKITLTVYGDSIDRSWSSNYMDEFRTENKDPSGTENTLVGHKMLNKLEGCDDGSMITVQRQGENVCFSYQHQDVGNDGTDTTCVSKCIKIGSSVSLETYDKLTTKVTGGLYGAPVVAYYFGETRDCRIQVSDVSIDSPSAESNSVVDNDADESSTQNADLPQTQVSDVSIDSSPSAESNSVVNNDADESSTQNADLPQTGPQTLADSIGLFDEVEEIEPENLEELSIKPTDNQGEKIVDEEDEANTIKMADDCKEAKQLLCESGGEDSMFFEIFKEECNEDSISCPKVLNSSATLPHFSFITCLVILGTFTEIYSF